MIHHQVSNYQCENEQNGWTFGRGVKKQGLDFKAIKRV